MTKSQHSRKNFLGSIAILSAGTVFGSAAKYFHTSDTRDDLQKNWTAFWKKSGGRVFHNGIDLNLENHKKATKGHYGENGAIIYFPRENILAQPTWIYWGNDHTKPADVAVYLFESNSPFKKIICLNRFETDALYRLSKEPGSGQLLLASFNNSRPPVTCRSPGIIRTKTNIKGNSLIQDISYHNGEVLVFEGKLFHHN